MSLLLILGICLFNQDLVATKVWVKNNTSKDIKFSWTSYLAGKPGYRGTIPGFLFLGSTVKPDNIKWADNIKCGDDLGGIDIKSFKISKDGAAGEYKADKFGLAGKGNDGRYWFFCVSDSKEHGKTFHVTAQRVKYDIVLQYAAFLGLEISAAMLIFGTIGMIDPFISLPSINLEAKELNWRNAVDGKKLELDI